MKDEHTLITELMAGSRKAFEDIYNMYARRLYGFVYSYLRSRQATEDVVQDIFVKLWQNRQMIKQTSSLKALLFTTGRNIIISAYRKQENMPAFEDYMAYTNSADVVNGSAYGIEYDEFYRLVMRAVNRLPVRQQDIIRMSRQQGLRNKEIAERLGLSEQTVKNQLSLGLKAIRAALRGFPVVAIEFALTLM